MSSQDFKFGSLRGLGSGTKARIQKLSGSDEEDDEVDYTIPSTWGSSVDTVGKSIQTYEPSRDEDQYDDSQLQRSFKYARFNRETDVTTRRIDVDYPENDPLAATFGTTAVLQRLPEESDVSHRQENLTLDIDADVRKSFLPTEDIHLAPERALSNFEIQNKKFVATRVGASITQMYGDTYVPKIDPRVRHLDRNNKYIGKDLGAIKKSYLQSRRQAIKERDMEMLVATKLLRTWQSFSPDERAVRLEALRKPIIFWDEQPGAADCDVTEYLDLETLPEEFTRKISIRSIRDFESLIAETFRSDSNSPRNNNTVEDDGPRMVSMRSDNMRFGSKRLGNISKSSIVSKINSNSNSDNAKPGRRRNDSQVEELLRNLTMKPRHATRTISGHSASTTRAQYCIPLGPQVFDETSSFASGSTSDANFLAIYDDSPELQHPADSLSLLAVPRTRMALYKRAVELCKKNGRAVTVVLDNLVKFTPRAITRRVFGGVVQEIQLHPDKRTAVVIFLHVSEAKAFVDHVMMVREAGTAQERRDLQIEASWYQNDKNSSIVPAQPNLIAQHVINSASRTLRLHRIPLEKTREQLNHELGFRLNKLLVSLILATPKQKYMQVQFGRQAIVEFASIKDAIEAREALLDSEIADFEDCVPDFIEDASNIPAEAKNYCFCMGCKEQKIRRE